MSCAIIIPARLSSTRLAEKLLRDDTGQALICHTVDVACAAAREAPELFTEIIVATDAAEIVAAVEAHCRDHELSVQTKMTRADHPSGSDRIAEVAAGLPPSIDSVLNLQGDEPELDPAEIVALAKLLNAARKETSDGADAFMATLAYPLYTVAEMNNPNLAKVVCDEQGNALYFSRAAIPHDRDGDTDNTGAALGLGHLGIYAYTRAALTRFVELRPGVLEQRERLEQLRALGNGIPIRVRIIKGKPHKGVDTADDYAGFVARESS